MNRSPLSICPGRPVSTFVNQQLWSAYKFFQLVSADGTPTSAPVDYLDSDVEARQRQLNAWLGAYYPELMKLDLAQATVGHFSEAMRAYGLGAETQKSDFVLLAGSKGCWG